MESFIPDMLLELLSISVVVSVILMSVIQKFKTLNFITKDWQIWLLNFIFSFAIGIPFAITFYQINIVNSIWVALFSFVGAPTIYDLLKSQNIINFTPKSLNDKTSVTISTENEIKRD